ncbi:MAG: hypothetical protein PHN56_04825 [Candidatus Nanoarchaeia archaeon]|nr:hypothetical protein [Candidatus Nanoarchaeia archaeon]
MVQNQLIIGLENIINDLTIGNIDKSKKDLKNLPDVTKYLVSLEYKDLFLGSNPCRQIVYINNFIARINQYVSKENIETYCSLLKSKNNYENSSQLSFFEKIKNKNKTEADYKNIIQELKNYQSFSDELNTINTIMNQLKNINNIAIDNYTKIQKMKEKQLDEMAENLVLNFGNIHRNKEEAKKFIEKRMKLLEKL